jgi:hypothetical protein
MMRKMLVPAVLAGLVGLLTCSQAHAYGAAYRSGSYTNPYTGRTTTYSGQATAGPNGVERTGTVTSTGPGGTVSASGGRAYSPAMYGGYSAGGSVSATGPYGSYTGGVYRP